MLTDAQIEQLLFEPKPLPQGMRQKLLALKLVPGTRDKRSTVKLRSDAGHYFSIAANFSLTTVVPNKFSIQFRFHKSRRSQPTNLIRCNGWHGPHTNSIEQRIRTGIQVIPANTFHMHRLTERYQGSRFKADGFAEPTNEYHSFATAIDFVCSSFGFYEADDPNGQLTLF